MKTKVSLMFNKKANVFAVPESINSSWRLLRRDKAQEVCTLCYRSELHLTAFKKKKRKPNIYKVSFNSREITDCYHMRMDSIRPGFPGTVPILGILQHPVSLTNKLRFGWRIGTGAGEKDVWNSGNKMWSETGRVDERICTGKLESQLSVWVWISVLLFQFRTYKC